MHRQRGSALIVVILALVVLMLMGVGLLRTVGTSSDIAGNIATKQTASEAASTAIQAAVVTLTSLSAPNTAITNVYYPLQQAVDANGLPSISWSAIPQTTVGGFKVQYVLERMCSGTLPINDTGANCSSIPAPGAASSSKLGAAVYIPVTAVYYRVTARVTGPHNNESFVQAILSK